MNGNEVTNVTNPVKLNHPQCIKSADALSFTSSNHMSNVGSNSEYPFFSFHCCHKLLLFYFSCFVRHLAGNNGFSESDVQICILAPCRISCDAKENEKTTGIPLAIVRFFNSFTRRFSRESNSLCGRI